MAIDVSVPRSRRALLAGGIGGMAALTASALGRPLPAAAGSDGDVVLGGWNYEGTTTTIFNESTSYAFKAEQSGPNAQCAVMGVSTNGAGVIGSVPGTTGGGRGVAGFSSSSDGTGVYGYAKAGTGRTYGVAGTAASTSGVGVWGDAFATSGSTVGVMAESHSPDGVAVYATNQAGGDAVYALSYSGHGVRGTSETSVGVYGASPYGMGVHGESGQGVGLSGRSSSTTTPAVRGLSSGNNAGVCGYSGMATIPTPAKTGVFGYADQDATAAGVYGASGSGSGVVGRSTVGRGVLGETPCVSGYGVEGRTTATSGGPVGVYGNARSAPNGTGVLGWANSGDGVNGITANGNGVEGTAIGSGTGVRGNATSGTGGCFIASTGYALYTKGRIRADKASGLATITTGTSSVTVSPGLDVTTSSFVLLTARSNLRGRDVWYTTNTTANTITIRASSAVTADLKVGWLLLG